MHLKLFDLVDETIKHFEMKQAYYRYVQARLEEIFRNMIAEEHDPGLVAIHSRVKSEKSLREKMIRNQFYLFCRTPEDVLLNLSDLIGITLQCRFIRNEAELYNMLFRHVENTGSEYSRFIGTSDPIYLNLAASQPQLQRNGFQIYRIDGYYIFNNERVNFELQIKSLVHNFWSEIEHEVVYKNPYFVMYDRFNREMLGAIRDNLDVVDRQLEIMYNEITRESQSAQIGIGMDEKGFKTFVSRSINELVNRKMKESLGFASDFKKCSAMIAQYVYVRDFVNNEHNQQRMIDYLLLLNQLNAEKIDFKEEISLGRPYSFEDPFSEKLARFFEAKMNTDFQWHVFFAMLFMIQPGNNLEDFVEFIGVMKMLLIQPTWFNDLFADYSKGQAEYIKDKLQVTLVNALCKANTIEIVHEDKLLECMDLFRDAADELENRYASFESLNRDLEDICDELYKRIGMIFK